MQIFSSLHNGLPLLFHIITNDGYSEEPHGRSQSIGMNPKADDTVEGRFLYKLGLGWLELRLQKRKRRTVMNN